MKWSDYHIVKSLLETRQALTMLVGRVDLGQSDSTIQGHYQSRDMTDDELEDLADLHRRSLARRIADVDVKLAEHGITVDPEDEVSEAAFAS